MRPLLGRIGLAAAGIAATLLAMEIVVRATGLGLPADAASPPAVAAPLPPELRDLPELRNIMELARPRTRGVFQGVLHRTNSAGMRGPEVSERPPEGTFRIVVVGDSITMGQGVDESDAYSARLERALEAEGNGRRYEVLNLGVSGHNIEHAVTRLKRVGLPHHPDLVVYGFTLNDIEGPAYVENSERDKLAFRDALARRRDSSSALLRAVWPRLVLLRNGLRPLPGSYAYALERNYLSRPQAWAQIESGLDRLAAISRQRDVCVNVFIHAAIQDLRLAHPFRRVYARVEEAARERGLYVTQSYPHLRGRDASELRLSVMDPHPSAEGHRLLAEALLEGLRALPARCGLR